ncbi:hypothetical protein AB7B51_17415 [Acinetobacter baumannii]|uniref:hypothetical protein n=1 Tax=Acinetobacter baumannii TaxID=470 RepID=UPI0034E26DEF
MTKAAVFFCILLMIAIFIIGLIAITLLLASGLSVFEIPSIFDRSMISEWRWWQMLLAAIGLAFFNLFLLENLKAITGIDD